MKNIYAHTGPTPKDGYVGYISVNQRESGVEVSVRSEGNLAPTGVITLTPEQCEHLATDLLAHINGEPAKPDQQVQAGEIGIEPAIRGYERFMDEDEETDPIERLRFFCSIAMNGRDWLDVEQFFSAVLAERTKKDAALKACVDSWREFQTAATAKFPAFEEGVAAQNEWQARKDKAWETMDAVITKAKEQTK